LDRSLAGVTGVLLTR